MKFVRAILVPLIVFLGLILFYRLLPTQLDLLSLSHEVKVIGQQIAGVFVWLSGAFLAVRLIRVLFWEEVVEHGLGTPAPRLMIQLGNVFVFLLAVSGILTQTFDQSVSIFWTASGAFGLVVAFALRQLILDTFSGIAIHMERPFKVGDWIEIYERTIIHVGRVEETNWRTTRLWTNDRNVVIIPNSLLTTSMFSNLSMPDAVQRFSIDFTMDFAVAPERVKRVLLAAVQSAVGEEFGPIAEPEPEVRVEDVKTDGVVYRVYYFCSPIDGSSSRSLNVVISHVLHHIDKSGLSFNYRKSDVFVTNMPWRQREWQYERDRARQLGKLSLFKALKEEDLVFIAGRMELQERLKDAVLVHQGDAGDSMYILAEGLLEVRIKTETDEILKVAELEPGSFFGEKSLLTGAPRSATIVPATDVLVGKIAKPVMAELFDKDPKIAEVLSRAVVERDFENSQALEHHAEEDAAALLDEETGKFMSKLMSFFGKNGA